MSDIHGNLPALEAVLEQCAAAEEIWCLGDIVGYGAWPNECVALVRERCTIVLAGNHDLAAVARVDPATFVRDAGRAITWTREVLRPETEAYLSGLEASRPDELVGLYHGSPRDPIWEYVLDPLGARAAIEASGARLTVVGHTHSALSARLVDDALSGGPARGGAELRLRDDVRALVNPGSVGQPRDADPRAAWAVLDLDDEGRAVAVRFQRTTYDIGRTQRAILAAGLPHHLADRLEFGM